MDGMRPVRQGSTRRRATRIRAIQGMKMANSRTAIAASPNAERPQLQIGTQ